MKALSVRDYREFRSPDNEHFSLHSSCLDTKSPILITFFIVRGNKTLLCIHIIIIILKPSNFPFRVVLLNSFYLVSVMLKFK